MSRRGFEKLKTRKGKSADPGFEKREWLLNEKGKGTPASPQKEMTIDGTQALPLKGDKLCRKGGEQKNLKIPHRTCSGGSSMNQKGILALIAQRKEKRNSPEGST